uniref:Diaminopimelate epimerase n=1 Tax=Glossina austeni TaxID=7395 RepID=A0A1A9UKA2_GLOAU
MESHDKEIDFYIHSSEAVQCVNGIRCAFRFLHLKCLTQKNKIYIGTTYNRNHIELRVYERGVGNTYCCGSAAAATVALGIYLKKLNHIVKVNFLRGNLQVSWKNDLNSISIAGPAEHVYDGQIIR